METPHSKRYVITTYSLNTDINFGFYQVLQDYCFQNKAKLIVLTTDGNSKNDRSTLGVRTADLEFAFDKDIQLFTNLKIFAPRIKPHQNLVTRGTAFQSESKSSIIVPCNRHDLISLPTEDHGNMFIIGTGSMSEKADTYGRSMTALKAEALHTVGAIVVEVEDIRVKEPVWYFRQIQYSEEDMSISDLNKKYSVKVNKETGEPITIGSEGDYATITRSIPGSKVIICPGDLHAPKHDPKVLRSIVNLAGEFKSSLHSIILQDGMNQGYGYSHHQHLIGKAQQFEKNQSRIIDERTETLKIFKRLEVLTRQLIHIPSNHDDVVERLVTDHRHITDKDYVNYREAQVLSIIKLLGINVYEFYLNHLGRFLEFFGKIKKNLDGPKKNKSLFFDITPELSNSKFVPVGDPWKMNDILVYHGDKGANGSRSLKALPSLGKVLSGHTHSPFITGDHWCVGTSSLLDLSYNKGISSWSQSMCLVHLHSDGTTTRQMLTVSQKTGKVSLQV